MSKNKNVPKLRFPGFTDEWEQRKLNEVVIIYCNNFDDYGNRK